MPKYKKIENLRSYIYDKTNEFYEEYRGYIMPSEKLTELVMECVQHSKKLRRVYDKAHNENFRYIPKSELVLGGYYFGICRNSYFGFWNGNTFEYPRVSQVDTYMDEIEHFDDVKNSSQDGFIPVKNITTPFKITKSVLKQLDQIVEQVGYYKKCKYGTRL